MPETRDRIARQNDIMDAYINQRRVLRDSGVYVPVEDQATGTPFRWRGVSMVGTPRAMVVTRRKGGIGSSRFWRSPASGRPFSPLRGKENIPPGSSRCRVGVRGRGGSVLPSWYPRTPLRDITAVVKAIERRRARREEGEGLETKSPILQDQTVHDPSASTSVALLEQNISATSPFPTVGPRHCAPVGKVPKVLLNIVNQSEGDSACLTPQKKLLNNIETVERMVMKELDNLKRTPAAKKAEKEKRVKTLMSLR